MASSLQIEQIIGDLNSCSIENNDEATITNQLKQLDIHFNWSLHQQRLEGTTTETIVSEFERKLKEMFNCESDFTFKSFCCQLTMAQELIKYDTAGALMKVLECEPLVLSLKTGTCRERAFISIREAVEYIYYGCKAFALFKCGSTAEAKKVLLHIPDYENIQEEQKSGVYGIKACAFMEYGPQGCLEALEYISIARTMNPAMAEWHFLTGKLMSRIRHIKGYAKTTTISDEEENFYRTAYNLDKDEPSYALYMAQITREKSKGIFDECRYNKEAFRNSLETLNRLNKEASSLYKMLIQSNQNDPYILGRCAFGMAKLPIPYKRLDLAEDAIVQALKVSPENPLVNHYAGLIYQRFLKDNVKGLKYLERAANKSNYIALLDWLSLKHIIDPENYDPLPELTKALEYKDFASTTLTVIGSWYFFKKGDVIRAWDHVKEITDDNNVQNHKSHFLNMRSRCNLLEVIFDEVKLKLAECKFKDEQEKEELMSISERLQILCPQSHPTGYNNLRSIILKESDGFTSKQGNESMRAGAQRTQDSSFLRTASSSSANKKNKIFFNPNSSIHKRPLYFPKHDSNATNRFNNN